MASELSWRHSATGEVLYATIRSAARQMWSTAGTPALENLTVANWANYAITMTETPASSYFFVGTWPAGLTTAGWYWVDLYKRVGGSPAISDTFLGTLVGYWDGTTFTPWADDTRQVSGTAQTARDLGLNLDGKVTDAIAAPAAALVAANLDHLALTATAAADMTTEVADNTVLARIIGNGDTSTFVPSTDGLRATRVIASAISAVLSGITSLAAWLRGLARKDAMDSTAKTELNTGNGTFNEATDSNEALRDTEPMGTAMRGTDGAYTGTPPTGASIAALILVTPANKLVTDANGKASATVAAGDGIDAAAVKVVTDKVATMLETIP